MKKHRGIFLKNAQEIAVMREANQIVARILDAIAAEVAPGVQTMVFEELAQRICKEHGVTPAFQGYHGFPFAICCSVNEEIVHGFPSGRELKDGDIVSVDMGVIHQGFFGDSARTFAVGAVPEKTRELMDVTRSSLLAGIEQMRPGNRLYDVSRAVQQVVETAGMGIVRRFVGHGIGRKLHEKPEVPNFVPGSGTDVPLLEGMVLAIEPMVTLGGHEVEILADNWTAVTKDRSLSAHYEHSVAVTKDGPLVLSESPLA